MLRRNGANYESWKNHDVLILLCREIPFMEGNTKRVQARVTGQVAPVILGRSAGGPFERLEGMHDGPVERLEEMHDGLADRFEIALDPATQLYEMWSSRETLQNQCMPCGKLVIHLSQCAPQEHEDKKSDHQLKHDPSVASRLLDRLK